MLYPVSHIQKQFYINHMMHPKDTSNNIPLLYGVKGNINIEKLESALNTIVKKYDILRSVYSRQGTKIFQSFIDTDQCKVRIEQTHCNGAFGGVQNIEIDEHIHRVFILDNWPLFRVKLFSYKDGVSVLSIVFHHIILDLQSKHVFARELSLYYNQNNKPEEVFEGPDEASYLHFVNWEIDILKSDKTDRTLTFWEEKLQEDYKIKLPLDYERKALNKKRGKRICFSLSEKCVDKVNLYVKNNADINVFTILLCGYALLCNQLSGQDKIVIGIPFVNRQAKVNKPVFGCLINTLPLVLDFKEIGNENMMSYVFRKLYAVSKHQKVPFLYLLNFLNKKIDFLYDPIFQVGFTNKPPAQLDFEDVEINRVYEERRGVQLDMFLTFWEEKERILGYWEFRTDLFKESTIRRWIVLYEEIVGDLLSEV